MDILHETVIILAESVCGVIFNFILLPFFRKIKTGKFDVYIGSRFEKDGSEPRGGGAVMLAALIFGILSGTASLAFDRQQKKELFCCGVFIALLASIGLAEDIQLDKKTDIGIKPLYRFFIKLSASAGFIAVMSAMGFECGSVLLPFRLGYITLGRTYIPITALLMTLIITAAENHDCQRGIYETGIDGLCLISFFTAFVGAAFIFNSENRVPAQLFSAAAADACLCGALFGLSPAKIYPGKAGGMMLGAAACSLLMLSGLHFAVLFIMAAPLLDILCTGIQTAVFAKNKKLLFKGASLHEHLRAAGWNDYKIMGASALLQFAGVTAAAAFAIYESRIVIQ